MILLWGMPDEAPLAAVAGALRQLGVQFFLLDQNRTEQTRLELAFGRSAAGKIRCDGDTIELASIRAAYLRPYPPAQVTALAWHRPDSAAWQHACQIIEALWTWAELTEALVVNRPFAMASNNSKPFQAALIQAAGFATPATVVTNRISAVRQFRQKHGDLIYKSVSSQRSIVAQLGSNHSDRWRDLRWCPTQFQRLIPGMDIRVHVVGDECFSCAIESDAVDYRYAEASRRIRPYTLPADCARRCRELTRALGLFMAGLDLRQAPDGEWHCFEANPSPGFTFFDPDGEQGIALALAKALMNRQAV